MSDTPDIETLDKIISLLMEAKDFAAGGYDLMASVCWEDVMELIEQ